MSDTPPKRRKLEEALRLSPKTTKGNRKIVPVNIACVGDRSVILLIFAVPGRDEYEPYMNYIRIELEEANSRVRRMGVLCMLHQCRNVPTDEQLLNQRNYPKNCYLVLSDSDLFADDCFLAKRARNNFIDVRILYNSFSL